MKKRTTKLTQQEIDSFLLDHLPYRIKILDLMVNYHNKVKTDPNWPSIYESGQITCRMFIEFLGLGVNGKNNPELQSYQNYFSKDGVNSYEVKIADLGIQFIELQDLNDNERKLLAHAYESGNRATAHLTYGSPFNSDPEKVIKASILIKRILDIKLFKNEK